MSILQAGKQALRRITSREEPEALPYSNKYRVEALEADNRSGPELTCIAGPVGSGRLLTKSPACAPWQQDRHEPLQHDSYAACLH